MTEKGWTPDRVALVEKRWSEGATGFVIAQELGAGISRNAVLGLIHRSGFKEGRTKFPRSVKSVEEKRNHLLVSGHNNVKIGRDVRKGKLKGYWIYTLTLEERKTCPSSCLHWQTCYGNSMPYARRIDHTDPAFLPALELEIASLCVGKTFGKGSGSKPLRRGVLIRLHALGDFYSVEYVNFWMRMLTTYPNLAIYGYTARQPWRNPKNPTGSFIGNAVAQMNTLFGDRCMIRFSDGGREKDCTVSIGDEESCPPNAFICPEQTNKTLGCGTCGACWSTHKNVAFLEH